MENSYLQRLNFKNKYYLYSKMYEIKENVWFLDLRGTRKSLECALSFMAPRSSR